MKLALVLVTLILLIPAIIYASKKDVDSAGLAVIPWMMLMIGGLLLVHGYRNKPKNDAPGSGLNLSFFGYLLGGSLAAIGLMTYLVFFMNAVKGVAVKDIFKSDKKTPDPIDTPDGKERDPADDNKPRERTELVDLEGVA